MQNMLTWSILQNLYNYSNRTVSRVNFEKLLGIIHNEFEAQILHTPRYMCVVHSVKISLNLVTYRINYKNRNTTSSSYADRMTNKMFSFVWPWYRPNFRILKTNKLQSTL